MSSTAQVFPAGKRQTCYECKGEETLLIKGKRQKIECRAYTPEGLAFEIESALLETELMDARLIETYDIGVNDAKFSNDTVLDFTVSSEGTGGLSKQDCGSDYQAAQYIKHEKLGHTSRMYIHTKTCVNQLISTELQDWAFPNNQYSDKDLTSTRFSDMLTMAARRRMAIDINHVDIIGIFKSSDENGAHYDGILAQAYWAYTKFAYFNTIEYEVNETVFINGTFIHAKYSGETIDIELNTALASDPVLERYQTRAEAYTRLVQWLNELVDNGGRKYIDASLYQNKITVSHKWTARLIQLALTIDTNAEADWLKCTSWVGIDPTVLQNAMPVDERPYLVQYNRYTVDNVLTQLTLDIHGALSMMDMRFKKVGQSLALYIDEKVWNMYMTAKALPTQNVSNGSIAATFTDNGVVNVYTLSALNQTGLWFATMIDNDGNESNRNVRHLTDSMNNVTMPRIRKDEECDELVMKYDQLHGVMVKDFRLFAANLLCSPFAAKLKDPQEAVQKQLPCYNAAVRSTINDNQGSSTCTVQADFRLVAQFRNAALYGIIDLNGNLQIETLNVGDTLPNGALPIYEVRFEDYTTGIPIDQLGSATYSWVVTYSDGSIATYTGKDLIIQFAGNFPLAFNVAQTVSVGGCTSTHYASEDYGQDYPFQVAGSCADLNMSIVGRINDFGVYEVTSTAFNTAVTVTGAPDATIDLSANTDANSAAGAATIINAYFQANSITGSAEGNGTTLTVVSQDVIFVNIDPLGTPVLFDKVYFISMYDQTDYDPQDGLGSVAIKIWCQADATPVNPTDTDLMSNQRLPVCSGDTGWKVSGVFASKLGCTVNGAEETLLKANVPSNGFLNFTLVP